MKMDGKRWSYRSKNLENLRNGERSSERKENGTIRKEVKHGDGKQDDDDQIERRDEKLMQLVTADGQASNCEFEVRKITRSLFDQLVTRQLEGTSQTNNSCAVNYHVSNSNNTPNLHDNATNPDHQKLSNYIPITNTQHHDTHSSLHNISSQINLPKISNSTIHLAIQKASQPSSPATPSIKQKQKPKPKKRKRKAQHQPQERRTSQRLHKQQQEKDNDNSLSLCMKGQPPPRNPSECCLCPSLDNFHGKELESQLLGPFVNRKGQASLYVHADCAYWAPRVYFDPKTSQPRKVYDEYRRGRRFKCSHCAERGATIGCYEKSCKKVFHYRCLLSKNARKIENYFAAFCENHQHLADDQDYLKQMEREINQALAASDTKRDSTQGLDAPHSVHTRLRLSETEIIFSTKWRICSHSSVLEGAKVVFSLKKRGILRKNERLSISHHVRCLPESAVDLAAGKLSSVPWIFKGKANLAMEEENNIAFPCSTTRGLFLLRNLKKAPVWTSNQIHVTKKSDNAISSSDIVSSNSLKRIYATSQDEDAQDAKSTVGSSRRHTRNKSRPKRSLDAQELDRSQGHRRKRRQTSDGLVADRPASMPLSSLKKTSKPDMEPIAAQLALPDSDNVSPALVPSAKKSKQTHSDEGHSRQSRAGKKKRTGQQVAKVDRKSKNGDEKPKRKSAWEMFLDEQLPRERILRPDENERTAMQNMARLWSLLDEEGRGEYYEKAKAYNCESDSEEVSTPALEVSSKDESKSTGLNEERVVTRENLNVGMFGGGQSSESRNGMRKTVDVMMKGMSVSLPQRKRGGDSFASMGAMHMHLREVDWDDLLPTELKQVEGSD